MPALIQLAGSEGERSHSPAVKGILKDNNNITPCMVTHQFK